MPVYDLLGGKTRDYARCYCHVQPPDGHDLDGRATIEAMVEHRAASGWPKGWRFVRYGAGDGG